MNSDYQDNSIPESGSADCPSPTALFGFADRTLRRSRVGKIRTHLERCESCSDLLTLMASPAVGRPAAELPEEAVENDRALVARQLGFTIAQPFHHRLLALADNFWHVRTPLLVPVTVAVLLLFVLLPLSRPVVHRGGTPLVYHFTEINQLISTDHTLRSVTGEVNEYRATAGSLIFLRHSTSRPGLAPGDAVTLSVSGENTKKRLLLATISPKGLIEIPLSISRPGHYRLQLTHRKSGTVLATMTCTIHTAARIS